MADGLAAVGRAELYKMIKENKDIPTAIKIKTTNYNIIQKYKNQANHFGKARLKEFLDVLTKLDYDSKVGKIDPDIGLRSGLCNYFN